MQRRCCSRPAPAAGQASQGFIRHQTEGRRRERSRELEAPASPQYCGSTLHMKEETLASERLHLCFAPSACLTPPIRRSHIPSLPAPAPSAGRPPLPPLQPRGNKGSSPPRPRKLSEEQQEAGGAFQVGAAGGEALRREPLSPARRRSCLPPHPQLPGSPRHGACGSCLPAGGRSRMYSPTYLTPLSRAGTRAPWRQYSQSTPTCGSRAQPACPQAAPPASHPSRPSRQSGGGVGRQRGRAVASGTWRPPPAAGAAARPQPPPQAPHQRGMPCCWWQVHGSHKACSLQPPPQPSPCPCAACACGAAAAGAQRPQQQRRPTAARTRQRHRSRIHQTRAARRWAPPAQFQLRVPPRCLAPPGRRASRRRPRRRGSRPRPATAGPLPPTGEHPRDWY